MAKFSELTAITNITDSDLMMITDAETNASKKITWANVKSSIDSALTIKGESNNAVRLILQQADDASDAPDLVFRKSRGTIDSPTSVAASDVQMRIHAFGYDGSSFIQGGNIGFISTDGDANAKYVVKTRVSGTLDTRFEIDGSGRTHLYNDLIQTPSSSVTPSSNGQLVVEATNDTTLTFKLKGSDGTVRTGTITLS